jgi:3-oxoacyl-[acyl-carrier-protein] synthase III
MPRTIFLGTGHYVPEKVVTNDDLAAKMDTSDEWIRQRTGIETRRFVDWDNAPMGSSDLGTRAAANALADAKLTKDDIDCIIYATLSPDKAFPGDGVIVQAKLDVPAGVPCFDIRNQCSGFLYGLQMADAFIRSGVYEKILLIGAEVHSSGLEFTDRGRDVAVIFGDGAAAVVLGAAPDDETRGVLSVHLHADGRYAEVLQVAEPSSGHFPRMRQKEMDEGRQYPHMEGKLVFKHAVVRMPEAVEEALAANGLQKSDIDLLIPHQANLRISEMVQRKLELPDDKVFNNIMKYGNTTACSIPLALDEAVKAGRLKKGGLLCLTAFGAGFTWGAALVRW